MRAGGGQVTCLDQLEPFTERLRSERRRPVFERGHVREHALEQRGVGGEPAVKALGKDREEPGLLVRSVPHLWAQPRPR